jgi:hypothetical protein
MATNQATIARKAWARGRAGEWAHGRIALNEDRISGKAKMHALSNVFFWLCQLKIPNE